MNGPVSEKFNLVIEAQPQVFLSTFDSTFVFNLMDGKGKIETVMTHTRTRTH